MEDRYDFDSPEEALTEIIKILESDALLKTEFDAELETMWADAKEIRKVIGE